MNKIENFSWAVLLIAATMAVCDSIPVVVKYQQLFADQKISITERMSILDRIFLRYKEGFVQYE